MCVYSCWSLRRPILRKCAVTYQCQYFTINSSISGCNHKGETRNAEPEIGTDWSSQTQHNPRVDGYGSGFGLPRVRGSGFRTGLESNRPVLAVPIRTTGRLPGLVANTTLIVRGWCLACCWCPWTGQSPRRTPSLYNLFVVSTSHHSPAKSLWFLQPIGRLQHQHSWPRGGLVESASGLY